MNYYRYLIAFSSLSVYCLEVRDIFVFYQVTYKLADNTEYFSIDEYTGNITTRVTFDRESQDVYNVKVIASDNSPSALYSTGEPNRGIVVCTKFLY